MDFECTFLLQNHEIGDTYNWNHNDTLVHAGMNNANLFYDQVIRVCIRSDRDIKKYANKPSRLSRRQRAVDVLYPSKDRDLSAPLIKSQMNDISGAIISCRYYRDGYYVSRGAFSLVLLSLLFSISLALTSSLASPLSLSISLLLLLLSGNALTVACKESGHCAARKQKPRLRERARISIIEYTYILRKGTMTKAPFRQNFRGTHTRRVESRAALHSVSHA